ncbi:MAG: hypothetical protein ACXAC7_03485 [Candidatus Hodarchaeales archaeon]|jgi:hypothetical protein
MSVRTKAWIARQPYNVRYTSEGVLSDDSLEGIRFIDENPSISAYKDTSFQRGVFWPSLVLVEKSWEGTNTLVNIYIRVYKKKLKLLIDLLMGHSMDIITELSEKYDIPIYRIITSKKGKRGSVQKLLDFQE